MDITFHNLLILAPGRTQFICSSVPLLPRSPERPPMLQCGHARSAIHHFPPSAPIPTSG
jgi:hypothetical protein